MIRKRIVLFCVLGLTMFGCSNGKKSGYYKAVNIDKLGEKAVYGITEGYMNYLLEVQPYIQIKGDSIIIPYPDERIETKASLQTFTNAVAKYDNSLLDTIYDITYKKDTLKILFNYTGTRDDDQRFSLNYVPIGEEEYLKKTEELIKRRDEIRASFKPLDLSSLEIPSERPYYLTSGETLFDMDPMLFARNLVHMENVTHVVDTDFKINVNEQIEKYTFIGIDRSDYLGGSAAKIDGVDFTTLEFYVNSEGKNIGYSIVSEEINSKEILALYSRINKNEKLVKFITSGLPIREEGKEDITMSGSVAAFFEYQDKVVLFALVANGEDMIEEEKQDVFLNKQSSEKQMREVYEYYLKSMDDVSVQITVLSKDFNTPLLFDGNQEEVESYYKLLSYYVWLWSHRDSKERVN